MAHLYKALRFTT